ncbi:DNA polymerase ligase-domain-containing protein [Rostrohypoxylon terebratum]|nr:DNA polymerase ligase-domain-containing protein [Rostrohypoxylon terebratum]
MATKRNLSLQLVDNPFIKKRNLGWTVDASYPPQESDGSFEESHGSKPSLAEKDRDASAVEAGKVKINDHLDYFNELLTKATLSPFPPDTPRLSIGNYKRLYEENSNSPRGAHFIVHQHDHPIAGTHYDLRLQINDTSSASWAIMYGPPGDPNSRCLNRNATETRIHCLWNHLIETASVSTGSLLIWDTGTYTVLPPRGSKRLENSHSQSSEDDATSELTEQEKLHQAFQTRKIRLRLNGTRLPPNYVLNLRLTKEEDVAGRIKSTRAYATTKARCFVIMGKGSDPDSDVDESEIVNAPVEQAEAGNGGISPMEREIRELEDEEVRRTNAYPGAVNLIGSVHQRRWHLSLDREACGFTRKRKDGCVFWELDRGEHPTKEKEGDDEVGNNGRLAFPFHVRGVDVESSVVTGRKGADVPRDEGVEGVTQEQYDITSRTTLLFLQIVTLSYI